MGNVNHLISIENGNVIELTYSKNVTLENQSALLKLGLEKANQENILDNGFNVIIDVSNLETMDKDAAILTFRAGESVKIDKIAVFGPEKSVKIISDYAKEVENNLKKLEYFNNKEEALCWLKNN